MKKCFCSIIASVFVFLFLTSARAAGYTLPQKMLKQLQVGSGLTGSFVIHGNADPAHQPLLHVIQNSEYEIVGIKSDDYLHYHVFQSVDSDTVSIPAEFLGLKGRYFFRSSFFDGSAYAVPDTDQLISLFLHMEGENEPVFAALLNLILSGSNESSDNSGLSSFEKIIDLWISGFTPVTTIQKDDRSVPSLTEVFTIPVESMFNTITKLIQYVSQDDSALSSLRSVLSEDQIDLYFNPDLAYYYLEAMSHLNLQEDIVFTRTVSTMGDLLESTICLPLDEAITGYSSIIIHNDDQRKNLSLTGSKGTVFIDLPLVFPFAENEYDETVHFVLIRSESNAERNLALKIDIRKTHDEHSDPEETKAYETDHYLIRLERDVSVLPDGIDGNLIPETETVEAEAELQYSSKSQIYSSPTTLEFSVSILQGLYHYTVTGRVKTASPEKIQNDYTWTLDSINPDNAVKTAAYSFSDFSDLISGWIEKASEKLIRTPEEIRQTETD